MRKNYSSLTLASFAFSVLLLSCAAKKSGTDSPAALIQKKYSALLGVSETEIANLKLYSFIDEWYGTPYQYAGKSKTGVDCSGFTIILLREVFGKEAAGPSASLYNQCEKIAKEDLQEGDLVFFKIESKDISHVGVYLQNSRFVHASNVGGVMINDLNKEYYLKYFAGAGRVK